MKTSPLALLALLTLFVPLSHARATSVQIDSLIQALPGERRVGQVVFRYPANISRAAEALGTSLERTPLPGLPPNALEGEPVVVVLAPDEQSFSALAPAAPDWSGGIAYIDRGIIVLPTFGPRAGGLPLATVLRHELAHVALQRYLGRGVPRWFHEGYAQLAARSWSSEDAWSLRLALLFGSATQLDSLALDFSRRQLESHTAYQLAYTAVETLYRLGGEPGLRALFERWRELGELDRALRVTYGLTLSQYERYWKRELKRRYGWLLVVTQATTFWAALTILLLILGYWKQQRDRQKLEALRARERELDAQWPEGEPQPWELGGDEDRFKGAN